MWSDIVRSQMHELNLIANWASIVQLGRVRDLCRIASSELAHELARAESMELAQPGGGREMSFQGETHVQILERENEELRQGASVDGDVIAKLKARLAAAEARCASDHSGDGTDMSDKWATSLTESDVLTLRGIIAEMRDMPGNDRETFRLQALAKRIEEML